MQSALILVDIQQDYFPGGAMDLVGMPAAARRAATVLAAFRSSGKPVFHIRHLARNPGATFFLPGTRGAEIHADVFPRADETVVEKHFPNSFRETGLQQRLEACGVGELVICGAMSHMCIDATVRAAFDHGHTCRVVEDACATRDLTYHGRTIEAAAVHGAFMAALSGTYADLVSAGHFDVSAP